MESLLRLSEQIRFMNHQKQCWTCNLYTQASYTKVLLKFGGMHGAQRARPDKMVMPVADAARRMGAEAGSAGIWRPRTSASVPTVRCSASQARLCRS